MAGGCRSGDPAAYSARPPGWRLAAALLVLLAAGRGAQALYFHIGETEKRCFIEEIPDETMVIGNYRTQLWDKQSEAFLPSTPGLGMFVEVKDPYGKMVLSRQYGSEGRFTFTSHTPGEHQICLHSNSTRMALFAGGKLVSRLLCALSPCPSCSSRDGGGCSSGTLPS
ncbi:emp24 domain-containing 4 [Podarcis lilfordi]|uniref:Emp24 domain-containing 4 n=1 Tax=Podarcis lilfordi TaxID=74358 RepID=A0AA35KT52_9SAUR|nr:emp24 domain-containing 4 [Podarcis lilfordi]